MNHTKNVQKMCAETSKKYEIDDYQKGPIIKF